MTDTSATVAAPVVPKENEFYDQLMALIEPELTSEQLPLLEARYADESPEQKEERRARYQAAFDEFDRRATEEIGKLERQVHDYKSSSQKVAEAASRAQEQADMSALESSILAA